MVTSLLLVDDDAAFRNVYRELLGDEGYVVSVAVDEGSAVDAFEKERPRIVILDLMLPPRGTTEAGEAILERILTVAPSTKVIVASGAGEASVALTLVRRGAYDFLAKPVDPDVLLAVVARAAARLRLEDRVTELEAEVVTRDRTALGLLGEAPAFVAARTLAERAAKTEVPILITRRVRHRQGGLRAARSCAEPAFGGAVRRRQLRCARAPRSSSRRSSVTSEAPSRAPRRMRVVSSSRRAAGRCFSTRSVTSSSRFR